MKRVQWVPQFPVWREGGAQEEPDSLSKLKRHKKFQEYQGRLIDIFSEQCWRGQIHKGEKNQYALWKSAEGFQKGLGWIVVPAMHGHYWSQVKDLRKRGRSNANSQFSHGARKICVLINRNVQTPSKWAIGSSLWEV